MHPYRLARLAVLLLLLAPPTACAPVPGPDGGGGAIADLRVDRAVYTPGDSVELTLVNRSSDALGYNLCPSVLDRRVGGDWTDVPERPAEVCTMELRTLEPGASARIRHRLPPALAPGEYRFRTGIHWPLDGSRVGVASPGFQVAP